MSTLYDHHRIEPKWQEWWQQQQLFQQAAATEINQAADKLYLLFAFAYPSGSGLHVGHVESKTALDIVARYQRMNGKQVFFPVGWDAFGLPAENYAIKTGVHPQKTTTAAINTFRRQIKRLGISYDWANEIATCHPEYYRWTQWLFLELFQAGLAYRDEGLVNWCPSCQTVLANEQVVDGTCERCGAEVEQKELEQWYFRITDYQDELISGLDQVDWPAPTKRQQLNWIGKKEGINIFYQVEGTEEQITCFTTRPDTNFGATFVVLAPEHEFVQKIINKKVRPKVEAETRGSSEALADAYVGQVSGYAKEAKSKTELERQQEGRQKSGVFTGFFAINNLTGRKMPIWVSDFVLAGFGTGAVVGVPGHDKRDFEFAEFVNGLLEKKSMAHIDVIRVVVAEDGDVSPITSMEQVQEEDGTMINSDFLDGMDVHQATSRIMDYMEQEGQGQRVTTYKLRDWLISRQRYWGAPIPIIYDPAGQPHPIKSEHLPWKLPTDVDFKPTGQSPLTSSQEFINRTEQYAAQHYAELIKAEGWDDSGQGWRPEFDTMDTFVDSSWYFLRYVSSRDEQEFANPAQLKKWLPVDFYMIGPEHIVLHLLYSRFFTKFLRDQGYLEFDEPFMKMRHQGMILGPDGKKMSKSKGNVINPDDVVDKFGADTLRMYEMFMGPIEADKPWDTSAVAGVYRFLDRIYSLVRRTHQTEVDAAVRQAEAGRALLTKFHQTIRKLDQDLPQLKFNTAIAALMELRNQWEGLEMVFDQVELEAVVKLLAPLIPFMAEELYQQVLGHQGESVHLASWPSWDEKLAQEELITLAVQINGKVRGELKVDHQDLANKAQILDQARQLPTVQTWLADKQVVKEIYVPGKIVSLVVA